MEPRDASTTGTWAPQACTLPMAEQPLRIADWSELLADAVRGVERKSPTWLHLELRPGRQVAGRAAELAAAETDCCSFFTFTLTATGGSLALDVRVPAAHATVLDALTDQAAGAAGRPS